MNATSTYLSRTSRAWKWLGANKDAITIVFALIAGFTTLYQYKKTVTDGKRKETLAYVMRDQDVRIAESHAAINNLMFDKAKRAEYDKYREAAIRQDKPDLDGFEEFVRANDLRKHILVLVDHYVNIVQCVESDVCDRALACSAFQGAIEAHWHNWRPLFKVKWKERTGENFMRAPYNFVLECQGKPPLKD
ncbi:MAG: hypothetical protein IV097_12720 [Burkholderiaceae bacterium]|nr:hypothetical protein [Burkholderiaceae bacterium]